MYEISSQNEPHIDADPIEVGRLIRDQGLTPVIPNDWSPQLASLMKECWKQSANDRPAVDQLVAKIEQL